VASGCTEGRWTLAAQVSPENEVTVVLRRHNNNKLQRTARGPVQLGLFVNDDTQEVVVAEHLRRCLSRARTAASAGRGGRGAGKGGGAADGTGAAVRARNLLSERARLEHERCVADLMGGEGYVGVRETQAERSTTRLSRNRRWRKHTNNRDNGPQTASSRP
jgi:hypothetical protein